MAFMMTRVQVQDFDAWKPLFESDPPNAREHARGVELFRSVDDPNEVFVRVEYATRDDALEGRRRLVESGVLDRLISHTEPAVVEAA
jgi:hypothetical protein